MNVINKDLLRKCHKKLVQMKRQYQKTLSSPSHVPQEKTELIDLATREQQIQSSLFFRERARVILPEIYEALRRIKSNSYGVCELTGELIEPKRLMAVPWTRISMRAHRQEVA